MREKFRKQLKICIEKASNEILKRRNLIDSDPYNSEQSY